jgi:hypothetical protein
MSQLHTPSRGDRTPDPRTPSTDKNGSQNPSTHIS